MTNKEKNTKIMDKLIQKLALPIIAVAAVLLIIVMLAGSQDTTKQNNAYIRVINCIVSYPATSRTQSDVEQCYRTVENDLGIKLQRYDSSVKR